MKKLLGIVVLGLLLNSNSYAGHSKKILLTYPQCHEIELTVVHQKDHYYFYIKNPTKNKIKIKGVTFFTKDEDVITRSLITKVILPFHKGMFWTKKSDMLHQYLDKILVVCNRE